MATASPSRAGVSPSSSPRLPSPPPFTEVQFGPKSPSIGASITELELEAAGKPDDGASRRIRPGAKAVDMARGPPFVPLHQLESAFQLQEYLKTLYHKLTTEANSNTVQPVSKEMALELASPPTAADTGETVDRNLWLYELCRFLCAKTTRMIVAFFADNPPCSSQTCPEMRASEWQYLCAVHEPPKSCCAIDYCNHTLDWASNVLTSTKHFPSRLSLGGEGTNAFQSMRQLTNIFRRVYRIYAHAWFQHREVFWSIESELGLYMFFKTVCDVYQLIPEDNYTIPPDAEGQPEDKQETPIDTTSPQRMQILQNENDQSPESATDSVASTTVTTGATTRRHKHTPSTGVPVAVIAEGTEEDEEPTSILTTKPITTSPTRSTGIDRLKSPGRIELPSTSSNEAERIPEDPTPLAQTDTNPMETSMNPSSPSPKSSPDTTDTSNTSQPLVSETTTPSHTDSSKDENSEINTTPDHPNNSENKESPSTPSKPASKSNPPTTTTEETKSPHPEETTPKDQGDETMEKIELPTITAHPHPPWSASTEVIPSSNDETVHAEKDKGEDVDLEIDTGSKPEEKISNPHSKEDDESEQKEEEEDSKKEDDSTFVI